MMIKKARVFLKECFEFTKYCWTETVELSALIWKHRYRNLAITVAIPFVLLGLNTAFICITDENRLEENEATFTNPLTGNKFPIVSLAKACKIDGGCIENVALFSSPINTYSVGMFEQFIKKNPNVDTVCLRSSGGKIAAATNMAKIFTENKKLKTCMADYYFIKSDEGNINQTSGSYSSDMIANSQCASACNQVLLSAQNRMQIGTLTIFKGHAAAKTSSRTIGLPFLHNLRWYFSYSRTIENEGFEKVIDSANTPDKQEHLKYLSAVEHINHLDEIKTLTQNELLKYKIFTHQCDGRGNCATIDSKA